MKLLVEQLENRWLLAGDVEVVHVEIDPGDLGEQVTRVIRVHSEDAAEVTIRSQLTNELDSTT